MQIIDKVVRFVATRNGVPASLGHGGLHGEAFVALEEAVHTFDPDQARGAKFSTYAATNIKGRLLKRLNEEGRNGYLPRRRKNVVRKLYAAREKISQRLGRYAGWDLVSQEIGTSLESIGRTLIEGEAGEAIHGWRGGKKRKPIAEVLDDEDRAESMDGFLDAGLKAGVMARERGGKNAPFLTSTPSVPQERPSDVKDIPDEGTRHDGAEDDAGQSLEGLMDLAELSSVERDVLRRRHPIGTENLKPETRKAVSDALGLSIKQVRMAEERALEKIKAAASSRLDV